MKLTRRLQAVADLVTPGNRVADVGCDHAYTSIYLAANDLSPHIVAMDINQGPLERAKANIVRYGCEGRIETRQSDGIKELKAGEADTILIGGMGGALVVRILTDHRKVLQTTKELVLQPQSEIHKVRQMLTDYEFSITNENMIREDGKYYVMLKAIPNQCCDDGSSFLLYKKEHFLYGRLLLEQRNPILYDFLTWEMELCNTIMKSLYREKKSNSLRLKEIKERMELISIGLGYYEAC